MLTLILLIAACVCFALAAFNIGGRVNLVAVGLFCWALTELIPRLT